jgi:Ran GTPase-activating protein (RanGAP) involved in mRNA processing and transport
MNGITDFEINYLCTGVSKSNLYVLDLHANDIGNQGLLTIAKMLVSNKSLCSLSLEENAFDDIGIANFCNTIKSPSFLGVLNMTGNSLDIGIRRLIEYQNSSFTRVELEDLGEFEQEYNDSMTTLISNEEFKKDKIKGFYKLYRNIQNLDFPAEIKNIISGGYGDLFGDFRIVKLILDMKSLIGSVKDEYPFDSRSLERVCHHLHKYHY